MMFVLCECKNNGALIGVSICAAASAAQIAELSGQLDSLREEHGEVSDSAREAEKARADEAKKALAKLNDVHQSELTAVKRQLLGLEDRCQSLMNERTTLQKQLRSSRSEHDAALRAAKTAAAAAAAGVSEEAAVAAALSAAAGAGAAGGTSPPARRVNSSWSDQDAAGVLRAPGSRSPSPRARSSPIRGSGGSAADAAAVASASPRGDTPSNAPAAAAQSAGPAYSGEDATPASVPEARDAIEATGAALPAVAPALATSPLKAQASSASVDSAGVIAPADAAAAVAGPDPPLAAGLGGMQPLTAAALEEREASVPLMIDIPPLQINTSAQADMSDPANISISEQVCPYCSATPYCSLAGPVPLVEHRLRNLHAKCMHNVSV